MTEQNLNALNADYDAKMTRIYESKIQEGNLQIGNQYGGGDPEVTNLRFLEKFDIQTLKLYISSDMSVKLRSNTLKKLNVLNFRAIKKASLTVLNFTEYDEKQKQKRLNMNVDDLELENLEVLILSYNNLENDQLYNLTKFKKLHSLTVSENRIDLTHIHNVTSLTKLVMRECGLKNIDQIQSLVNLKELDLSKNTDLDLSPLCKVKSLTQLYMLKCGLKNIDQIAQLTNLEVLDTSFNQLLTIDSIRLLVNLKELNICWNKQIDITPLKVLTGLIKLDLRSCTLTQLSALKPLTNLQDLDLSYNFDINISELQYLKNLTHLTLEDCKIVSIYVFKPLVNLKELDISNNNIVFLDANIDEMKKMQTLRVEKNRISFISIQKHPNYNNYQFYQRYFNISQQKQPTSDEVRLANKLRKIERPNIQLKEIQNQHNSLNTALNSRKQEINAVLNNARQSQIQFTANVVHLFQLLNQIGFE
ncbi:Conserved_hypothetical protein [Hexamita inflata]|uniref:Uncharacterized protein n=1 Tax=Hexamita inflata TaxID=28002 RepID=A0AA86PR73_9EUKA|nr:Conserved hypothetical protein [Hexamita inflata]